MTPRKTGPRAAIPRVTLALGVVVSLGLALAACAPGTTATPPRPAPTKIVAQAGDIGLCGVISAAEFTQVAGLLATQVNPGTTSDSLTGLPEVFCIYLDGSTAGQTIGRGTINYEVAPDAHTALTIYQTVRQAFTQVDGVRGIGDAAFAGTPAGASGGTGLVVLKGRLLLYLSVGGDQPVVESITERLAGLILGRVA
jgi:hypothetical protein